MVKAKELAEREGFEKYDRRSITSAENGRRAWRANLDAQVAELEDRIRELADSTSDDRLKFEALRYLRDCRAGKPFTAINPDERKPSHTDNRLQIAAQTLIVATNSSAHDGLEIADTPQPAAPCRKQRKASERDAE